MEEREQSEFVESAHRRVFVQYLPTELTENGVKHLFGSVGKVKRVQMRKAPSKKGLPTANAVVTFYSGRNADAAIRRFNCFKIGVDGPALRVTSALTREQQLDLRHAKALEEKVGEDIRSMPGFSSEPIKFTRDMAENLDDSEDADIILVENTAESGVGDVPAVKKHMYVVDYDGHTETIDLEEDNLTVLHFCRQCGKECNYGCCASAFYCSLQCQKSDDAGHKCQDEDSDYRCDYSRNSDMAKEWMNWARNSVGYRERGLTNAHYDKLCRGPMKEVMQFLQTHIKSEEETRMIKENIALFTNGSQKRKEEQTSTPNIDSLEKEMSQSLMEIQFLEDQIKRMEGTLSGKASESAEKQQEIVDLQRRGALLNGILKQETAVLDECNQNLTNVEQFLDGSLSKTGGSFRSGKKKDPGCRGCKNGDALMKNVLGIIGEAGNGSKLPLKDILRASDVKLLVTHHTAGCLANAIMGLLECRSSPATELTCTADSRNPIELLQDKHVDLLKEVLALADERNKAEKAADTMKQCLFEKVQRDGSAPGEDQSALQENLNVHLLVVGLYGALDWIERANGKESSTIKDALKTGTLRFETDLRNLNEAHSELESMDAELERTMSQVMSQLRQVSDTNQSSQAVVRDFVENYKSLLLLIARFNLASGSVDRWSALVNGLKAADVFNALRSLSKDGCALADLFVHTSGCQAPVASVPKSQRELMSVLSTLWEAFEDPDENPQCSLAELQNKATAFRDKAIAELTLKLESSEELTLTLQSQCQRLRDALTEWSIQEAEACEK